MDLVGPVGPVEPVGERFNVVKLTKKNPRSPLWPYSPNCTSIFNGVAVKRDLISPHQPPQQRIKRAAGKAIDFERLRVVYTSRSAGPESPIRSVSSGYHSLSFWVVQLVKDNHFGPFQIVPASIE